MVSGHVFRVTRRLGDRGCPPCRSILQGLHTPSDNHSGRERSGQIQVGQAQSSARGVTPMYSGSASKPPLKHVPQISFQGPEGPWNRGDMKESSPAEGTSCRPSPQMVVRLRGRHRWFCRRVASVNPRRLAGCVMVPTNGTGGGGVSPTAKNAAGAQGGFGLPGGERDGCNGGVALACLRVVTRRDHARRQVRSSRRRGRGRACAGPWSRPVHLSVRVVPKFGNAHDHIRGARPGGVREATTMASIHSVTVCWVSRSTANTASNMFVAFVEQSSGSPSSAPVRCRVCK